MTAATDDDTAGATDDGPRTDGGERVASESVTAGHSRWSRLRWRGLLAVLGSVLLSSVVYVGADALGAFPAGVYVPPNGTLSILDVVRSAVIGAVGATAVFWLFDRFLARSVRWFLVVAAVVLVLSFAQPVLAIPGAPLSMVVAFDVMHVAVAAASVGALLYPVDSTG